MPWWQLVGLPCYHVREQPDLTPAVTLEKGDRIWMPFASAETRYTLVLFNFPNWPIDAASLLSSGGLWRQLRRFCVILLLRPRGMEYLLWGQPLVVGGFTCHERQWIALRGQGSCVKASYVDSF